MSLAHRLRIHEEASGCSVYLYSLFVGAGCESRLLVGFTSRALFVAAPGGNDSAVWGPAGGPDNFSLGNSYAITSSGGLGISASMPGTDNMALETRSCSPFSWCGNFAPGDRVLFTGDNPDTLRLTFGSSISGVGFQMQQNVLSPLFLGTLSAFESANNLLGFFAENGMSNANNDNSAISLGVLDTTGANIAYVTIGDSDNQDRGFGINQLSLKTTAAVPQPASVVLLLTGIAALWVRQRWAS